MPWKKVVTLSLCLAATVAQAAETGKISGTVTYGSEWVPGYRIYALSSDDWTVYYAVATKEDQTRFEIRNLAPGRYVLVGYPEGGDESHVSGWARDGVPIPVDVTAGETTGGVTLEAWDPRVASFPSEPPPTPGLGVEAPSCHARSPQIAVGMCFNQAYERADRVLNAEYRRVMALKNVPQRCRDLLRDAQRAWIPFRDAHCSYEGNALYSGRGAECMWEVTAERTEYLKLQDRDVCLRSQ